MKFKKEHTSAMRGKTKVSGLYPEQCGFQKKHKKYTTKGDFKEGHIPWNSGITPFYNILRNLEEYKEWRMNCLKRDWFRCQECFSKDNLEVHHKKSFKELVESFLQKYNQFSPIEDRETLTRLAMTYELFWNVDNGKTLCEECHKSLRRNICQ